MRTPTQFSWRPNSVVGLIPSLLTGIEPALRCLRAVGRVACFEWNVGIKEHGVKQWPLRRSDCLMKYILQKKIRVDGICQGNLLDCSLRRLGDYSVL